VRVAKFYIRSLTDPAGYTQKNFPGGVLPRSSSESYVPWAALGDEVVYALTGQHTSWRGAPGLRPYDTAVSQDRRAQCESLLGAMALRNPAFTQGAVLAVSRGVMSYLEGCRSADAKKTVETIYKDIGAYFFTAGKLGFGRLSTADKATLGAQGVYDAILRALVDGSLDQKLSIHDAVGRKLLPTFKGAPLAVYDHWKPLLRGDWFEDVDRRGRKPNPSQLPATDVAGIVPGSQGGIVGTVDKSRNRGVDMFVRDTTRMRHPEADSFYDDLDSRNLLFGAGISGTTGTLLQSALAFGKLGGDQLKEYVLAIIGYLVGGGMHSYHESMTIANKAGVPYTPGAFIESLPAAFTGSGDYTAWKLKYYDIVVLGAIHWRYNPGVLPSHLNKQLR
jgi:hypothetical protein